MTGAPAQSAQHLASALLDATLVVVGAERRALQAYTEQVGAVLEDPLGLDEWQDTHPLLLQFWNVSEGRMRPFGIDSEAWWDLLSAAWGGSPAAGISRRALAAGNEWAVKAFGSYHEFLCAIPDVRLDGLKEPALLVERMYTDSPFARIVDRGLGYGFGKQAARFGVSPRETRLSSPSGQPLASFRVTAPLQAVSAEHANLVPRIQRWLGQYLVGCTAEGQLVASHLSWTAIDQLTPVSVEVRLGEQLGALLPHARRRAYGAVPDPVAFRQRCRVEITAPRAVGARRRQREWVRP